MFRRHFDARQSNNLLITTLYRLSVRASDVSILFTIKAQIPEISPVLHRARSQRQKQCFLERLKSLVTLYYSAYSLRTRARSLCFGENTVCRVRDIWGRSRTEA